LYSINILQDLSLIYKHIKYIYLRIVIVVGDVDSVDRIKTALYVGWLSMTQAGYWAWSLVRLMLSLWRELVLLSHRLSTGKAIFSSNPHLGEGQKHCPYMGVQSGRYFEPDGDFSTVKPTYPQIIATYPQLESSNEEEGGLPCP
jgi:hypothetical protein